MQKSNNLLANVLVLIFILKVLSRLKQNDLHKQLSEDTEHFFKRSDYGMQKVMINSHVNNKRQEKVSIFS